MEKLTPRQITSLHDHLLRLGLAPALVDELLDHLACELEQRLQEGLSPETALNQTLSEADGGAVRHLQETYRRELTLSDAELEQASLDDIVFQFRNKAYGAYDLRRSYPQALRESILLGVSLFVSFLFLIQTPGPATRLTLLSLLIWTVFTQTHLGRSSVRALRNAWPLP